MYKGVSQLLALLIVVVVVTGACIAAAYIVSGILSKQNPVGSDVVGQLYWLWQKTSENRYAIYVHGPVSNVGTETVNFTGVEIAFGGKKYKAKFTKMSLRPSDWNEMFAWITADTLPPSSVISVIIHYCSATRCSASVLEAKVRSTEYLTSYEVVTYTKIVPVTRTVTRTTTVVVSSGSTATVTKTVTTTRAVTSTRTVTVTATATQKITTTQTVTSTQTVTTTKTTTTTITTAVTTTVRKPAWLIRFYTCYSIDDYIYVYGYLDKSVNKDAEYIPYVVKFFRCGILSCTLLALKPFAWADSSTIVSSYGPVKQLAFGYYKVEVWSVDPKTGELVEKIWEHRVDTSVRCA